MISKLYKGFLKYILIKLYYFKRSHFKKLNYELNFQNVIFDDLNYLRKIFLDNNLLNKKLISDKDLDYNAFDFLKVARILGGSKNVNIAKKHIINWDLRLHNYYSIIWSDILTSKRFINLIYNYDFYAISSNKRDILKLHKIIFSHFLANKINLKKKISFFSIEEIKSLLLGLLIYEHSLVELLIFLKKIMSDQIDSNGFHKSYNPSVHVEFINHLYEIKNILLFFNKKIPPELDFQIINMSSLLMNLFHKDGTIALFNGANNFNLNKSKIIINQSKDINPKKIDNFNNGIIIYSDNNKKLFFDVVSPENNNLHNNIHSGTLSFEFSCHNEKIITNCGSVEKRIGSKPEYLRFSAAHSTVIVNNTNISELVEKKSYKRIPKNISFKKNESENFITLEGIHDGYISNYNKVIKRELKIGKVKNELFGKDTILNTKSNNKKILYNIRFHLMPNCNCLISQNKKTVFIKTKNNQSWLFKSDSILSLEDSIYLGDGKKIQQNKQIVISAYVENKNTIHNWSFVKS